MEVELVTLKFKQLSLGRQPLFPLLRAWVAGDETAVTMVICAFFGLHHVLNPGLIPFTNIHHSLLIFNCHCELCHFQLPS